MGKSITYENLLTLLERSEARIDKLNNAAAQLADTCTKNIEMYDKHLTSLEHSRDEALTSVKNLTKLMRDMRDDYHAQVISLRNELHTLRDEYRKDLDCSRAEHRQLVQSLTKLAEQNGIKSGSSKAEVTIQNR